MATSVPSLAPKAPAPSVGAAASDSTLTDNEGRPVRLSDLWREKPLILVFLRHFGCIFCREHLALLKAAYPQFQDAGGQVACVGHESYRVAKALHILLDLPFPLLTCGDNLAIYREWGLGRASWAEILSLATIVGAFRAMRHGHRQAEVIGDGRQMAGAFVIDRQGIVRFVYRNKGLADHVSNNQLLTVLTHLEKEK